MLQRLKIFWLLLTILSLAAGCVKQTTITEKSFYTTPLRVGSQQILVEVADTDDTREQGLSGRPGLTDAEGMLFDFSEQGASSVGFWMKDMKFALDLIWINDHKIIGITPNVPPQSDATAQLPIYYPPSLVTEVLEVRAGWAAAHSLQVGDEVKR